MKDKIKDTLEILYVSYVDISEPNGPGINEREFVSTLCKTLENRVHLILPRPKRPIDVNPELVSFIRPVGGIVRHFLVQLDIFKAINSALSARCFDLIVTRIGILPMGIALYGLINEIPMVIKTFEDPTLKYLRKQRGLKGFVAKIIRYPQQCIVHSIISKAIGIDVCTHKLLEENQRLFKLDQEKIIHIDNATNTIRFSPISKNEAREKTGLSTFNPIIGFVGGKPWERGGNKMIDAMPLLVDKYPDIGCVIVGGDEKLQILKEKAKKLNVCDRCVFTGVVPYEDVPNWINSFDVGIAFDLEDRVLYLGNASQKIRQYVACGRPVIAISGGNAFLEDFGLGTILENNDTLSFVTALERWLSLSESEKKEHEQKASGFAQDNLSVERTLIDRLNFWLSRLAKTGKLRFKTHLNETEGSLFLNQLH